jgi:hypothetical protein
MFGIVLQKIDSCSIPQSDHEIRTQMKIRPGQYSTKLRSV